MLTGPGGASTSNQPPGCTWPWAVPTVTLMTGAHAAGVEISVVPPLDVHDITRWCPPVENEVGVPAIRAGEIRVNTAASSDVNWPPWRLYDQYPDPIIT